MDLATVLKDHLVWLTGEGGCRANLSGANLSWADLEGADLHEANLRGANLSGANLSWAYLHEANLRGANLRGANLRGAKLSGANLSWADLHEANLRGANLSGANLSKAKLPNFQICPEEGDFIGWKKLQGSIVAKLLIPAEAKRTSTLVGRKCRAEFVKVLELSKTTTDMHSGRTLYVQGEMVYPNKYDDDIRVECTHGIHFFITRKEAKEY